MDLSVVDRSATRADSPLHHAAPRTKLAVTVLLLVAVIVSVNVLIVLSIALLLVAVVLALRLPFRAIVTLALYPGVFAALYALAGGLQALTAALVIVKAITSALVVLLLMFTTPYPQVFAPIQRVLPGVLADALFMTYRSLFLLLEKFSHTLTAARLRAGVVGAAPARSAATVTRALGGVLLYSIDMSQRTHDVMHLRGYDGRLIVTAMPSSAPRVDLLTLAGATMIATAALAWRIWWTAVNPYAWLPLAVSALVLIAILALRSPRRSHA